MPTTTHPLFLLSTPFILWHCFWQYPTTPRPKAYPRVNFPPKKYQWYQDDICPFTFRFPVYAQVSYDTIFFDTIPEDPCWVNLYIPDLQATWHLTLKSLNKYPLEYLIQQSFTLAYQHSEKAEYIRTSEIHDSSRQLYGTLFYIGGDAASNIQFYLTDQIHWFVRGALYIRTTPNKDSLKPVIAFLQKDLDTLLTTFHWKPRQLHGQRHQSSITLYKPAPNPKNAI